MKIHEYQAKAILSRYGVTTPRGEVAFTKEEAREAAQLAFIAVIQQLPPRQRAVVLLRDVLGWSAAEAATLLDGSLASINSALQRARETLAKRYPDGRPPLTPAQSPGQQRLLTRYL